MRGTGEMEQDATAECLEVEVCGLQASVEVAA
jgi:hypothetical protein